MGRANLTLYPVTGFMPALPPGLTEWLPSGIITAFLGLLWYEQKAGEARLNRRIDESRDGVNKRIDELKDDMKELRRDQKETRQKVDELPMKILELLRTSKHPVTGER